MRRDDAGRKDSLTEGKAYSACVSSYFIRARRYSRIRSSIGGARGRYAFMFSVIREVISLISEMWRITL